MRIESHELTVGDGHRIFYRRVLPENPRAALLLLHGLAERAG